MMSNLLLFFQLFTLQQKKKLISFCLLTRFFVSLVPPKFLLVQAKTSFRVLSFGNEIKNFGFCFAFRLLIRNFATKSRSYGISA